MIHMSKKSIRTSLALSILALVLLVSACSMRPVVAPEVATTLPEENLIVTSPETEKTTAAETTSPSAAKTEPGVTSKGETATTGDAAAAEADTPDVYPAIPFQLKDQFGEEHSLEDYAGKVILLNFWATWCPPCKAEMPDIQAAYEKYGLNEKDVVILGVASPLSEDNAFTQEGPESEVIRYLADNGYTYPTLMDVTGELFAQHGISSIPQTFMIDREGNLFGYVRGMVSAQQIDRIVEMTLSGKRE